MPACASSKTPLTWTELQGLGFGPSILEVTIMPVNVEVFSSPGCSKCGHAKDVLRKIAEEIGGGRITWREVNVLDEMDYAVSLGVLSTPAIAVNGKLMFTALPSVKKLRATLEAEIRKSFLNPSGRKEVSS